MGDYTPAFLPGDSISLQASANVTGGDPVEVSGSGTVAKAASSTSVKCVGMVGQDAVANAKVLVFARGTVHVGLADGAITAGDQLSASSVAGRMVKTMPAQDVTATPTQATINAAIANIRAVVGVALTTAADGGVVRWMEF